VIELFAFLRVGADVDRIVMLPITEENSDVAVQDKALSEVIENLNNFKVTEADCYAADKDHLLGAIETGFDSLEDFNQACSSALVQSAKRSDYREKLRRQKLNQDNITELNTDPTQFQGPVGQKSDANDASPQPKLSKAKTMGSKIMNSMKFQTASDDELAA